MIDSEQPQDSDNQETQNEEDFDDTCETVVVWELFRVVALPELDIQSSSNSALIDATFAGDVEAWTRVWGLSASNN